MTAQLTAQKISNYLCSVRFTNGVEPRLTLLLTSLNKHACTMTSTEPYEPTKIQFLQAAVSGTQIFLKSLLHNTATKAAGVKSTYTFEEYVASLLDQARFMTVLLLAPEDAIKTRTQCQRHGVMLRRWRTIR
jgi:hypothetical protein